MVAVAPSVADLSDVAAPPLLLGTCPTMSTCRVVVVLAALLLEVLDTLKLPCVRVQRVLQERTITCIDLFVQLLYTPVKQEVGIIAPVLLLGCLRLVT